MFARALNLTQYNSMNMALWCFLAFQAGAINAGGFLACTVFVSHTTGFATLFGAQFALGNFDAAIGLLTVPMFFLLGSMISAYFVDRRILKGKLPRYNFLFGAIGVILILVTGLGGGGNFSVFGADLVISKNFSMLALLCLASGIQNAAITSASGALIRTTHLTGMTTDLGIGFVRVFSKNQPKAALEIEMRNNRIRISLIGSFIFGSTVAAFLFYHTHYYGFLLPAVQSLGLMTFGIYLDRKVVEKLKRAS